MKMNSADGAPQPQPVFEDRLPVHAADHHRHGRDARVGQQVRQREGTSRRSWIRRRGHTASVPISEVRKP